MSAWWENFGIWFAALEPTARILIVAVAAFVLVFVGVGLGRKRAERSSDGFAPYEPRPPLVAPPRSAPSPARAGDEAPPIRPPARPLRLAPAQLETSGRYLDLSPLDRSLVEQALDAFRRRAGKGGEVGLLPMLNEAEEGRGARLLARAEAEYAKASGPQALGEAAWRLAGLIHPEDKPRALALYREAAELAPHLAGAWLGRALAAEAAGESAESAEALERASSRAREPRLRATVLAERAARAHGAGEAAEALRLASESAALWRPFALERTSAGEAAQTALASTLGVSGEAAAALGDWAQARLRFEEAMELTAYLATRRPADVERAWAAGEAADRMADFDEAEAKAREAARAALAAGRAEAAGRREAAVTALKIGDALRARGEVAQARTHYSEALADFEALALRDPSGATARRDRAVALERLGDVDFVLGDLGAARERYEANLQIRETRAAAAPEDGEARRDLALALIKLADLGRLEEEPGVEGRYERALRLARALVEADPQDVASAHVLVLALDRAATLAPEDEAQVLYEEILRLLRPLEGQGRLSADQSAMLAAVEAHLAKPAAKAS